MQLGHYEVWEEIGRGGMGVVYRGYDPLIGREVALKTIHLYAIADPRERQEMQDRLQREAQSAGRLSHPNIVTIYQIGYAELQPGQMAAFLAMEFVPGPNLAALMDTLRAGPPETIVGYLKQAAAALDYAHSRGVIHRDIKPANLLVTPEGVLKIADFGVAKIVTQTVTMTGTVLGSPAYMSPEQIKAERIDGRTDQYSLAVVAYELFSGRKPFDAETLSSLVYKIAQEPPPPLETVPPGLAGRVGPVLLRALAKDPQARFPTCTAFVEALEAALREPAAAVAGPAVARGAVLPAAGMPEARSLGRRPAARISLRLLAVSGAVCAGLAGIAWFAMALRDSPPQARPAPASQSASAEITAALKSGKEQPAPMAPPDSKTMEASAAATPAAPPQPAAAGKALPAAAKNGFPTRVPGETARPAVTAPGSPALRDRKAQQAAATTAEPSPPRQPPPAAPEPKPEPQQAAAAPPKPEPAAPQPPREPVRTPPRAVRTAPAAYTPEALKQGIEGSVLLSVDIDEQGIPRRARVLRSLDPGLDRKAIESLAGWRFEPATEDGRAVPSTANVEVSFQLVGAPRRTPPSLKSLKK